MPGVAAVHDSLGPGSRRLGSAPETRPATAPALTAAGVASQLRDSFFGAEAQRIQRGREEVLVIGALPPASGRTSYGRPAERAHHAARQPRTGAGCTPWAALQETGTRASRLRIDGRGARRGGRRISTWRRTAPGTLRERTRAELPAAAAGPQSGHRDPAATAPRGDAERIVATLLFSVPVALIFIYGLIASFLRSFIQPLLVLAGIPIAVPSGPWPATGCWVTNSPVTSIFGLIAVSGVVVNDTILLMHRYNAIRQELPDVPEIAAISAATQQRARGHPADVLHHGDRPAPHPVQRCRGDPVP